MLVTSKLKSSLMLFIFKCSPLDRRHLVWHASQGRPRCSALLGSITLRQPFGADTKAVGLARDLLWNLSQSCSRRHDEKHKCTEPPCLHTCISVGERSSPASASGTTQEMVFSLYTLTRTHTKASPLKIRQFFFFFVPDKCQQKFNLWEERVQQMPEASASCLLSDSDMKKRNLGVN